MTPELIGHARMCVHVKMKQDERGLRQAIRKNKPQGLIDRIRSRIERGETAMEWLKTLEADAEQIRAFLNNDNQEKST